MRWHVLPGLAAMEHLARQGWRWQGQRECPQSGRAIAWPYVYLRLAGKQHRGVPNARPTPAPPELGTWGVQESRRAEWLKQIFATKASCQNCQGTFQLQLFRSSTEAVSPRASAVTWHKSGILQSKSRPVLATPHGKAPRPGVRPPSSPCLSTWGLVKAGQTSRGLAVQTFAALIVFDSIATCLSCLPFLFKQTWILGVGARLEKWPNAWIERRPSCNRHLLDMLFFSYARLLDHRPNNPTRFHVVLQ